MVVPEWVDLGAFMLGRRVTDGQEMTNGQEEKAAWEWPEGPARAIETNVTDGLAGKSGL
jgi:hypothetical protein